MSRDLRLDDDGDGPEAELGRRASFDESAMSPARARAADAAHAEPTSSDVGTRRLVRPAPPVASEGHSRGATTEAWAPPGPTTDLNSAFVAGCITARLPPRSISVALRVPTVLDFTGHGMGDMLGGVLADALEGVPGRSLTTALLRDNRMSDRCVARLLGVLAAHRSLESVDLSLNGVRALGVAALLRAAEGGCPLRSLRLDSCGVGDRVGATLVGGLVGVPSLETLVMSRNELDVACGVAFGRLLAAKGCGLVELDASWNRIRQSGAVAFAEGLARNTRLEALDLGYNTFGSDAAVAALAGALRTNRALLHASVSHNGISARGCARLGAALAENHTLLGLHFDGNAGAVDPRGFVVRAGGGAGAAAADGAGHVGLFTRIVGMTGARDTEWAPSPDGACWVCNRWVEVRITYTPGVSGPALREGESAVCHLSLDNFVGEDMKPMRGPGGGVDWFEYYRVVPPLRGAARYFFSIGGVRRVASDAPREGVGEYEVNVTDAPLRAGPVSNVRLRPEVALPRTAAAAKTSRALVSAAFTKADSVFRDAADESPESLLAAFEGDWGHMRLPGVRHGAAASFAGAALLAGVRHTLLVHYGLLLRVFKAYARPFTITWGAFLDLMTDVGVAGGAGAQIDLGRLFTSVNFAHASDGRGRLNPDRQLTRTQFLDALVRVAGEFAGGKPGAEVPSGAVDAFIAARLSLCAKRLDAGPLRAVLYTREVDAVLRPALPDLEAVFVQFASTHCPTAALSRATLPDFLRFCGDVGALSVLSTTRDCERAFKLAQPVSPDELASDAHLNLTFPEWLEASCRLADGAPLVPPAAVAAGGTDVSPADVARMLAAHSAMTLPARLEVLVARAAALAARRLA